MNPGWNLGNTLDAVEDEGDWNNPKVTPDTFTGQYLYIISTVHELIFFLALNRCQSCWIQGCSLTCYMGL